MDAKSLFYSIFKFRIQTFAGYLQAMNYQETLDYMYSQLPMFQRIGRPAFKPDLGNSYKLMEMLGHPEKKFKSIHIAGTNGKGSTAHLLTSVFMEKGLKTGLYTSPHLKDFRERITVSGEKVPESYVVEFMEKYKEKLAEIGCSFFEMTVGMAFDWFARQSVDIAIIEVGMGGRLDSTNVITPELSIITNIGLDHTFFLGDTLEKIAGEKAGIIKKSVPVIIGKTQKETCPVFDKFANENQSPILYADQTLKLEGVKQNIESITIEKAMLDDTMILSDLETPLAGSYQTENIRTALLASIFLKKEWKITSQHIQNGLKKVIQNTKLQGRWQKLSDKPLTYCDTAHNTEGIELVLHQLKKIPKEKLHFVLGVVNDKNLDAVMKMLPENAQYYFCKADIPRGLDANELMERASEHRLHGKVYPSVNKAYDSAVKNASGRDIVFVGGSTFTVAEVL